MAEKDTPPGKVKIIAGKWRGRLLPVVDESTLRPTPSRVRETLFNWLQQDIVDARCLDLFAGSGALGIEALSRGAKEVCFVELKTPAYASLKKLVDNLQATQQCQVIQQDAIVWLEQAKAKSLTFDIIFLDPPFATTLLKQSLSLLIASGILAEKTLIYVESALLVQQEDLPPSWQILKQQKASEVCYQLILGCK